MTTNAAVISARLEMVRGRIEKACSRSGRSPGDVTLVGVSKRQPLDRVRWAVQGGLRILGESQVQEATAKSAELPPDLDWHMIGPLQSNKVKPAVRLFHTIHSVDRPKIALLLDREAARQRRCIRAFLQINVGREPTKHGFDPATFLQESRQLVELPHLQIAGLMAIPPAEREPERARSWFRFLVELRDRAAEQPWWPESAVGLSMGMSHDFEVAIEEGATLIRVGSSIFGDRI